MAGNAFNIGEVWNPICCLHCGAHLLESYCEESSISKNKLVEGIG